MKVKRKKDKWDEYVKITAGAFVAAILIFVCIYIFDITDMPSKFGLVNENNSKEWLAFSISFFGAVAASYIGFIGASLGLIFGLLISFNTDVVFNAASKIVYFLQYIFTALFNHENLMYVRENSAYALYASIPARIFPGECILIFVYGILAPLTACFFASRNVLKLSLTEVLHEE